MFAKDAKQKLYVHHDGVVTDEWGFIVRMDVEKFLSFRQRMDENYKVWAETIEEEGEVWEQP